MRLRQTCRRCARSPGGRTTSTCPRMDRRPAPLDADYDAAVANGLVQVLQSDGAVVGYVVTREADGAPAAREHGRRARARRTWARSSSGVAGRRPRAGTRADEDRAVHERRDGREPRAVPPTSGSSRPDGARRTGSIGCSSCESCDGSRRIVHVRRARHRRATAVGACCPKPTSRTSTRMEASRAPGRLVGHEVTEAERQGASDCRALAQRPPRRTYRNGARLRGRIGPASISSRCRPHDPSMIRRPTAAPPSADRRRRPTWPRRLRPRRPHRRERPRS